MSTTAGAAAKAGDKKTTGEIWDSSMLKRLLGLTRPFRMQFYISMLLALTLAIVGPLRPYLIQITVDTHILQFNFDGLLRITILLIALLIAESVLRYYFTYLTSWLGQSIIKNLRLRVYDHLVSLKMKYFDRTPIGTSTTRTINDVETINEIFSQGIITIVADILTLLAVMALMFYTDWRLTLVSLSTFPILIYSTYIFKEKIKDSFNDVRTQVARLNAFLQEHISGMKVIQIFNAEEKEMRKFKEINDRHRKSNIRAIWYYSVFFPVVEVILAFALGLMVWYGANRVIQYETTLGVLIAFILYINMLFRPLRLLADKFNTLQMGIVAADRVFTVLDTDLKIVDEGVRTAKEVKGEIEFRNLWFAYDEENWVLKNINFHLEQGKTLALVGATGSGKTSIINILNRFYEINKGEVCLDGIDIRDYQLDELRGAIGLVLQDVFLFTGSVYENITLRNNHFSKEQVIEAAKVVGAHDFIMRLPGGYDYDVMERGATLSMGQRQLISFTRAWIFNPKVLVLDEATSSIDTESELIIQHAITKLVRNRTSIIIAHRLSTIQHADKILVLDKGEIKEAGTHQELLRHDGHYRQLYEMQYKKTGVF